MSSSSLIRPQYLVLRADVLGAQAVYFESDNGSTSWQLAHTALLIRTCFCLIDGYTRQDS